jgi:hypothetical protein
MDELIASFIEIRDYVLSTVSLKVEVYMAGFWDVFNKHIIIKETIDIIQRELIELFPDFPCKYLPKCRFRIFNEELKI